MGFVGDAVGRMIVSRYVLSRMLAKASRPSAGQRYAIDGPDPVRILIVGGGLVMGYGVKRREDALDGVIARTINDLTGRGVVIERRVREEVAASDLSDLLASVATVAFDLVVWSPTFTEIPRLGSGRHWAPGLRSFLGALADSRASDCRTLVLGVPQLTGSTIAEAAVRNAIGDANRQLSELAGQLGRARFVYPPPLVPYRDNPNMLNRRYYAACRAALVPALERAFRVTRI